MQNPGMAGTPPLADAMPDDDAGCPEGCIPIPLAALAQPNDKEQMNTPGEGDAVTFQVDAVIDSVNGDTAYVKPSAVNGTPLEADDSAPDPTAQEDAGDLQEGSALRDQAQGMSQ